MYSSNSREEDGTTVMTDMTDFDRTELAARLAPARVAVQHASGGTEVRELGVHPLALLIPGMTEDDEQRLRDDIKVHGVQEPLVMFEDKVLDGRHRLRIAAAEGAVVRLEQFAGTPADARSYVWSANVSRRHLSQAQLALAADRFGFTDAARRGSQTWSQASKAIGGAVTPESLRRFTQGQVARAPQTAARIDAGDVNRIDRAVKLAAAELGTEPPPTVRRSAFDRLGCARGDVLAMHAAVLGGERLDPVRFAERAREIQQVLVSTDRLLRGQRDEIIRLP